MKNVKLLCLFLGLAVCFASCKKDDEDDNDNTADFNFKDQQAQGQVAGDAWMLRDGLAEISFSDSTKYRVTLWSDEQDTLDYCDYFFNPDGDRVIFSVPMQVGLYKLDINQGYTVTILEDETVTNNIATEGAIEITDLTTTGSTTTLSGRIDARAGDKNHVNGKFEAIIVCE